MMRRLLEPLIRFFRGLTKVQRIILIAASGSLLVIIIALILIYRLQFVPLYTGLSPQELTEITGQLQLWNEQFRIRGNEILVSPQRRDNLRLRLAQAKVAPEGGLVGFELFDKLRLTLTDFERQINYRRALEGELSRAIESLAQIERARVFITLPKKELYTEEEIPPTAAVRLHIKPQAVLKPSHIEGIVNLVAYAVEGLDLKNVKVIDQYGNLLTEELSNPEGGSHKEVAKQLALQHQEAQLLKQHIKKLLGKVVGEEKVEVAVTWEMNFDKVKRKEERYSMPGFEQLKEEEEEQIEEFKGEGAVPGGAPGVEAQMPTYKAAGAIGPMEYKKTHRRTDYIADKEEILHTTTPKPVKIAVAVLVDGTYEYDIYGRLKRDKEGRPIYKPRTPQEMSKFEDIVRAAIGEMKGKEYKDREYIVDVKNVQFDRIHEWALEIEEERLLKRQRLLVIALVAIAGVGVLAVLSFLILRLRRPVPGLPPPALPPEEEVILPVEEAKRIARERPGATADVLRTWLSEELE